MTTNRFRRATRSLRIIGAAAITVAAVAASSPTVAQGGPEAGVAFVGVPPQGTTALTTGGSATAFVLSSFNAACSGDSASDGYQVNTYMVPADVDPATLTFTSDGPVAPAGTALPLFQAVGGAPVVGVLTDITTGLVLGIPEISFEVFAEDPSLIAPGEYNIGFACWQTTLPGFLDKYWNVRITIAADAADVPVGITWQVEEQDTSSTTTSTTAASTTTTTTVAGGSTTTTTTAGGTTTTSTSVAGTTTTTSVGSFGNTTTTIRFGSGGTGGTGGGSGGSSIPTTGASSLEIVLWASVVLIVGRMLVLVARRVRVVGGVDS